MLKDMKIGLRLALGIGVVVIVLVGVNLFNLNQMKLLAGLTAKMYKHPFTVTTAVLTVEANMIKMHRSMKDVALAHNDEQVNSASGAVDTYEKEVYKNFDIVSERFLGDKSMYVKAREDFSQWKAIRDEVIALKRVGDTAGATAITKGKGATQVAKMDESLKSLKEFALNKAVAFNENAEKTKTKAATTAYFLIVLCLLFAITITIFTVRSITIPLKGAVTVAQQLATGNLEVEVTTDRKDETGIMLLAMKNMVDKLKEVISDINIAAENVADGSEELSSSAQSISEGTTQQASAIEETSASMEQMSSNIRNNSDNSLKTDTIAVKAAADARESGASVTKAVQAMREIAGKISIIEEISRQTNLLALNAAIEAARAGEHGKGFAVVASEVRKLAERSQKAAGEITQLSRSSVSISEQAGELLVELVPNIQKTSDLIHEISAASNEQNAGAQQINNALQQLDKIIQQNASAAEQLAATSEELNSQAETLLSAIGFFKTGSTTTKSTVSAAKKAARNGRSFAQSIRKQIEM